MRRSVRVAPTSGGLCQELLGISLRGFSSLTPLRTGPTYLGSEPQPAGKVLLDSNEFERMWRVVDTNLSSHSILRDRYRRRERGLTFLVLTLSIVATALAFLADRAIAIFTWQVPLSTGLGILTAIIFFLALAGLVLNWQLLAWAH